MQYFWTYWPDIPDGLAFPSMGFAHILAISGSVAILVLCLFEGRKLSHPKAELSIKIAVCLIPVLEIAHAAWLIYCGETYWTKLMPFHLCGMQVFFLPWAVFGHSKTIREFAFFSSILGGVLAILSPSGVVDVYPFFHFQTLQTLLLHILLLLIPLAMFYLQGFRPQIKNFPKILGVFLMTAFPIFLFDYFTGENYMFLLAPPEVSIAQSVFQQLGHAGYLLLMLAVLCAAVLLLYPVFSWWGERLDNKRNRGADLF